ncbi:MAG: SoxR reducing system RseC family protein [Candidatus Neomarinimicrobiota bacterium]
MTGSVIDRGKVAAIDGDLARVIIEAGSACESCGARILCAPGAGKSRSLTAVNQAGARVGDLVTVEESGGLLLKLSLLQYGLPLLGFITGVAGTWLLPAVREAELLLFIGGLIGLGLGGLLAWLIVRRMARQTRHFFVVSRILN